MSKIKKNNDLKDKKKNKTDLIGDTNTKKNKKEIFKDILPILPLIILVFFLPFIIRLKLIPLEGPFYDYWTGERVNADFFTYYKKIFIYLVTIWTMIHTFFFTKKIKRTKAYYFMGGYALLVILSTIFSDYPQIALHGFNERHEGMWVVLSYMVLMFCTINLINNEKQIKYIVYSLGLSGGIISIITIFQFFGMDIFETEFAKNLMVSREILSQIQEFNINLGEGHAYGVFYNPNYLGGYMSFYIPLMFGYIIFSKNMKEKILFGIWFVLSMLALIFSRSEAGILGTVAAIILMLIFIYTKNLLRNKDKEEYKKVLITRLVPIFLGIIIIPLSISYIPMNQNPLERIRKEAIELLTPNREKIDYKEAGPLNDIRQVDDQTIELVINNESTYIQVDDNANVYVLNNEKEIVWETDAKQVTERANNIIEAIDTNDDRILIEPMQNENLIAIRYHIRRETNGYLFFSSHNDKLTMTDSVYRSLDIEKDFAVAKHFGFEGKGNLATNRGYIWSRSIPLWFENILIGSGQDTFVAKFPQYDIYGAQVETSINTIWILVDKPHSLFIQIGIQSGLMSLIIIFIGLTIFSIKGVKEHFSRENRKSIIITCSISGWLTTSVFNDSIIGITPIIMILIGILLNFIHENNIDKGGKLDGK